MLRYLFDEHIPALIADFLKEQEPTAEIVQANYRFPGLSDPELLEWATENDYILVSQDINTLIGFAYKRIENNIPTAGVFILRQESSYRTMLEDLLAAMLLSESSEWKRIFLSRLRESEGLEPLYTSSQQDSSKAC